MTGSLNFRIIDDAKFIVARLYNCSKENLKPAETEK
jgi:hypothetical protein